MLCEYMNWSLEDKQYLGFKTGQLKWRSIHALYDAVVIDILNLLWLTNRMIDWWTRTLWWRRWWHIIIENTRRRSMNWISSGRGHVIPFGSR